MMGILLARFAGLVAIGGLAGSAGCSEPLCDPELSTNGSYTVRLVDDYLPGGMFQYSGTLGNHDPRSQGSCQGIDGLQPGASFGLRGVGSVSDSHNDCEYVSAELVATPAALMVSGPPTIAQALDQAKATNVLYVVSGAKIGDCSGTIVVMLYGTSAQGGIFAMPVVGDAPPAVVYRLFLPSTGTCQACDDNFAASLTKN